MRSPEYPQDPTRKLLILLDPNRDSQLDQLAFRQDGMVSPIEFNYWS
jgi:hypothetical protein